MDRKRDRKPRDRNERPGRRTPPPALTGAERVYFNRQVAEGGRLTLSMRDGEELSGTLVEHDRDLITLEGERGLIVVRKSEVRFIAE
jgi:hypothetical protein